MSCDIRNRDNRPAHIHNIINNTAIKRTWSNNNTNKK